MIALPTVRAVSKPSGGFEAEYQAVLNMATTLGYTLPSVGQRLKQNTLLKSLKTAGVFSKLDVLYVFATDGSNDFATLNWRTPTANQITRVNAPAFTSNQGYNSDGATSYLTVPWDATLSTNWALNNAGIYWSMFNTPTGGTSNHGHAVSTSDRLTLGNATTQRINTSFNLTTVLDFRASGTSGLIGIAPTSVEAFVNGTQISKLVNPSTVPVVVYEHWTILRSATFYSASANITSIWGAGQGMVTEYPNLRTAYDTYMASL